MKKLSYLLIGIFLALPLFTYGQSSSLWKFIGNLRPVVSTWRVDSPGGLSGSTTLTASHLKSCNTIDTNGNGVFTCGTDEGGSASTVNTGAILSAGDSRWVNTSGDTMTGALSITGAGLNVSGLATTNRNISLQSGGLSRWTVRVDNAQNYKVVRHDGAGSALDSPFEINPTTGFVQIGDVAKAPSVQLEVNGAMSGSTLTTTALKNCTNVSTSAGGVYACNNNVYLATSTGALKTFFDLHYLRTSTGSLKSLFDTLYFRSSTGSLKTFFDQQYLRTSTGSLKVFFDANYFRTSTGALKANFQQQFLASSTGAVKANFQQQFLANSTGGLRTAFGLQFIQSSTGALKKNFQSQFVASSTGALKSLFDTLYFRSSTGSLKTYFDQQYLRTSTGSLKTLFDANYFRTSTGSLKAYFRTLDEARYVNTGGDTMTGTLTIRGTMTGWHLFAGTMSGAGLTDCDADNQTLAWDATSRTFGCGDDDTSASGFDFATADARYVKKQGDTMSGALVILMTGGDNNTVSFETPHTMSGRILHAQNLLRSSGSLAVEGSVRFNNTGFVYDAGSNTVGIGAEPDGNYGLTLDSGYLGVTGGGIEVLGGYGYFAEDLEVIGTASGRKLHAQDLLTSSGGLIVEGAAAIGGTVTAGDFSCVNCLDFTEISDAPSLDATTVLAQGNFAYAFNLNGTGDFFIQDASSTFISFTDLGIMTFNADGGNRDLTIRGDNDNNLFVSDASADNVGIGTATPETKLEVVGVMSGTSVVAQTGLSPAVAELVVYATGSTVGTGTGKLRFDIPRTHSGFILTEAYIKVDSAGTTGTMRVDLKNKTKGRNLFTVPLMLGSTRTGSGTFFAGGGGTINTATDDVGGYDEIEVNIQNVHTTAAKGLRIMTTWRKP